jgi:putative ABC transport system substrate-binding protein
MSRKLAYVALPVVAAIGIGIFVLAGGLGSDDEPDQAKMPTVGILAPNDSSTAFFLMQQLTEMGYVEDETIQYIVKIVPVDDPSEYETASQSLIDDQVDVIYSSGTSGALAASKLTTTVPIVFVANEATYLADISPIMEQQGANTNLTGVTPINPVERRFQLMMETVPTIEEVYVPYDPTSLSSVETLKLIEAVADSYEVTVVTFEFSDDAGVVRALEEMPPEVDAIFLGDELPVLVHMVDFADLSIARKVPLIVPVGRFDNIGVFPPGVLFGYGAGILKIYQQAAELIDQLLQGAAPADLPIRPSYVYLTVSVGAADALGIDIPESIMRQANEILRDAVAVPAVAPETEPATDASPACNATLQTAVGDYSICILQSCEELRDTSFTEFVDRVPAESCPTEDALGICVMETGNSYFYSGNLMPIEINCATYGGEWVTPEG